MVPAGPARAHSELDAGLDRLGDLRHGGIARVRGERAVGDLDRPCRAARHRRREGPVRASAGVPDRHHARRAADLRQHFQHRACDRAALPVDQPSGHSKRAVRVDAGDPALDPEGELRRAARRRPVRDGRGGSRRAGCARTGTGQRSERVLRRLLCRDRAVVDDRRVAGPVLYGHLQRVLTVGKRGRVDRQVD